ncbi:TonB-dependent receptor [Rhodanobacter sp. PCA2]|nr:TonB-dependent receptor [Rhodanobacter sp. PCA2]
MKQNHLSLAIALACCMAPGLLLAQTAASQAATDSATPPPQEQRSSVSSTSNTTTSNDTRRGVQQLSAVQVTAQSLALGGGLMSVQTAPKAVSTISRDAIVQAAPGATFVQMIDSIPGVNASTDDVSGLANGNYQIRGFTSDEIAGTVNGAPINDSGNYKIYSTEYGDAENYGDITVLQGYPDVDMPVSGAAGGSISWVTIDPSHQAGLDMTQSFGDHDYRRTFLRLNTGDLGPVRAWLSYSNNSVNQWRGPGDMNVTKVDGKALWTIDGNDYVSASFQYNRERNYGYNSLTKAQIAQGGYFQSYDTAYSPTDTYYWKLHTNPFQSWLASMDGEFRLSDSLRLSVVPYFWYGNGGGGGGYKFTESTVTQNTIGYANQDINGDGRIGGNAVAYAFNATYTYRPGIIAKLNQDFGMDDSLEYGFWYERPRQQQNEFFTPAANGEPADFWATTDLIRYSNGVVQRAYREYTTSDTRKVFATNTWTPNDQWTVTVGAAYLWEQRSGYDYQNWGSQSSNPKYAQFGGAASATYRKLSPTAGVKYQLDDENQFYLGAGRTFRAPINGALLQNFAAAANSKNTANAAAGAYVNQPETATTVDLGWRFYADRFSANIDAYESHLKNKQISGYDNATGGTVYLSLPKMRMRGLTAEASYKMTANWTVYANYSLQRATLQGDVDTLGDGIYPTHGKSFLNTPKNSGYLRVAYSHGPLWASLDAKYRGAVYGDWMNTDKVGGYTVFNLNAGVNLPDLSSWLHHPYVKLNVFNLGDRRALTNANNIGAFLASNPGGMYTDPSTGKPLYTSAPYYSLLQDRTYMVTFGVSFH